MSSSGAHPRSRGENVTTVTKARAIEGSSPLTRGKRVRGLRKAIQARLIPAHAGKTLEAVGLHGFGPAHPRSRGENPCARSPTGATVGSSPLTRGKHVQESCGLAPSRLIPAHAGKTADGVHFCVPFGGSSPLTRGKPPTMGRSRAGAGSSPLTRGKRSVCKDERAMTGLIPAHAGKTVGQCTRRTGVPAHPRSRGENAPTGRPRPSGPGSSPLTRGKRARRAWSFCPLGLIPAHAGKTRGQESRHEGSPAHPRSRGENQAAKPLGRKDLGSSTLTRGKLPEAHRLLGGKRLIPAHAGKTRATRRTRYRMRAHPRSRGENPSAAAAPASTCGSSPLTRGKRQRWNGPRGGIGLIPAHAGKTCRCRRAIRLRRAHPRSRGEN